ncbi:MAG: hypothetical protein AB1Z98_26160 [Nannocystaceae bacterium]
MTPPASVLRALGLLLASKTLLVALPLLVLRADSGHGTISALAAVGLVGIARGRAWGSAALLCAFALRVVLTFPHTLNHAWFELLVALVLWRAATRPDPGTTAHAHRVLVLALLSVFFYSGVQKIAHGQFTTGEYLLRALVLESGGMTDALRGLLAPWGPLPSGHANELLLRPVELHVAPALVVGLRLLSIGTIVAEIGLPVLVALGVKGSRWALLAAQIGIGLVSSEIDFALTATGMVLLLWGQPPRAAWIVAFAGWVVVGAILWTPG